MAADLVSAEWLIERHRAPHTRVVDARWYIDGRRGRDEYLKGHVPGAVFVDLDAELAGPKGSGPGRHPLPLPELFASARARAGIGDGTHVIAYDDDGGAKAARLWWLLEHHGHIGRVSLLDGGWQAYLAAGGPTEADPVELSVATAVVRPGRGRKVVTADEVAALEPGDAVLLDARAWARFTGELEPVDPRAGHVPGARSSPYVNNLVNSGGRFLPDDELRARFAAVGAVPGARVIVYCGSGVTACHTLFALSRVGIEGELYAGSWSDWSADARRPVATGELGPRAPQRNRSQNERARFVSPPASAASLQRHRSAGGTSPSTASTWRPQPVKEGLLQVGHWIRWHMRVSSA